MSLKLIKKERILYNGIKVGILTTITPLDSSAYYKFKSRKKFGDLDYSGISKDRLLISISEYYKNNDPNN